MTLQQAIAWAENQKEVWEKHRGQPIYDYVWYVVPWNKEFVVITKNDVERYPNEWKLVYSTKDKFL